MLVVSSTIEMRIQNRCRRFEGHSLDTTQHVQRVVGLLAYHISKPTRKYRLVPGPVGFVYKCSCGLVVGHKAFVIMAGFDR
jgi:hypothetical protein